GRWKAARRFLTELRALGAPFGLLAVGWNAQKREWHSLDEMVDMTRSQAGRAWLNRARVRVFAQEGYLTAWRNYFADRMGFSHIPGADEDDPAPPPASEGAAVRSPEDLALWMRQHGLTDQALADRLGLSRSYISARRSGRRPWSKGFQDRVAVVAAHEAPAG